MPFATGMVLLIVVSAVWLLVTDLVLGAVAVAVFPLLIGLNVVYQQRVDLYYETAQEDLGDAVGRRPRELRRRPARQGVRRRSAARPSGWR